jgi:hypothetical protein
MNIEAVRAFVGGSGGTGLLALLRQLHPRVVVFSGCALLALAGMAAGVAWLNVLPRREQLVHLTGQLQELRLEDASTGAFKITLVSEGKLHTFHFDGGKRVVAMPSPEKDSQGDIAVALSYFEIGRSNRVVDVILGKEQVLSYEEVTTRTAEKVAKDRNSAIGIAAIGALLILFGGFARLVRGNSHGIAEPNPATTIGIVLWVLLYGTALMVMLTEPAILHRAFGTEAFHLSIEYVLPAALAVLFLPLWPGFMGLASLTLSAMQKGRGSKLGLVLEMGSALVSGTPAERRMAIKMLWLLTYFTLLVVGWIFYAAMLGI